MRADHNECMYTLTLADFILVLLGQRSLLPDFLLKSILRR
jgi:hypothetical protein